NGEKYLETEDYEQAIEELTKAIEIDPKVVEPYQMLANAYFGMDDTESATKTYETVRNVIVGEFQETGELLEDSTDAYIDIINYYGTEGDTSLIDEAANEITNMLDGEEDEEDIAEIKGLWDFYGLNWSYYNKLMEYQEDYGEGVIEVSSDYEYAGFYELSGLVFAELLDFDQDGKEELLLAYADTDNDMDYVVEVWEYRDNKMSNVFEGTSVVSGGGGFVLEAIELTVLDSGYYLVQGYAEDLAEKLYIYGYQDNAFTQVKSFEAGYGDGLVYYVDESAVDESEYIEIEEEWIYNGERIWYSLLDEAECLENTLTELDTTLETLRNRLGIEMSVSEKDTDEINENETVTVNEAQLREILSTYTDEEILNFIYDDFDYDGVYEAIAFCGEVNEVEGGYYGTFYLVTGTGVMILREEDAYWTTGGVLDFGNVKIAYISEYYATGDVGYYYQINGNSFA
ncbi:MAG: tetratricopeptide repeat protein, partial [Clostridiales bacterium]|nr:tetratricopeptide repeat protein [Clostridiales bacterium]